MASVTLHSVAKHYGSTEVIKAIDLAIADGELVVFVGPSGCGKSTLLRMIAGLTPLSMGEVRIGDSDMTDIHASRRGVAFVFQSYALYPHMNVARNIGFALETSGLGSAAIAQKVSAVAQTLHIDHLLERKPTALSGGQRQRVAIGRALVREPKVFLFDEPLSNLDTDLRAEMRIEIARLHRQLRTTMIYVTHDQVEAMTLAQRIVVLNAGRIEQVGTPHELYHRPANRFVAGFIGSPRMNFADAALISNVLPQELVEPTGQTVGIRPEALTFAAPNASAIIFGTVLRIEDLGHERLIYVELANGPVWVMRVGLSNAEPEVGQRVNLQWLPESLHWFGADGWRIANPAHKGMRA